MFVRGLPYRKKALVEADKRAAQIVGKENLVRALTKVQEALANRPELQKKWRVGPRVVPLNEAERIANLNVRV